MRMAVTPQSSRFSAVVFCRLVCGSPIRGNIFASWQRAPFPTGLAFLRVAVHILYQTAGGERGRGLKDHIWQRVVDIGNYILRSGATVRDTAKVFGVSKSTVHKDVTERLPKVNAQLANEVKRILEVNKAERHLRGGEATRQKFRSTERSNSPNGIGTDDIIGAPRSL